ncbi:MAG: IclR family transcriptional regulator [Acidobacteria bacterium]|nr:IclR family transcriptional regulator [Acidobacteriota bacterium]
MKKGYELYSLARALDVLCCFSDEHPEWGVTELAEYLGENKSTVHRTLFSLEAKGMVEQRPNRRYVLGLRVFELGNVFRLEADLIRTARPHMEHLARDIRLTVRLAVLENGKIYDIARADSPDPLWIQVGSGGREATCSAAGKVFLAYIKEKEARNFVSVMGMPRRTANSITDLDALLEGLRKVRRLGYAVENEELTSWIRSLAAPVFNDEGKVVSALEASGTIQQLPSERDAALGERISRAAQHISHELGYYGSQARTG